MPTLTPLELSQMEAIQLETMPATATIYRRTTVNDGYGGSTTTESLLATVPCDYARKTAIERLEGDQQQSITDWTIIFEVGTDISIEDRVEINGRSFEIAAVYDFIWATMIETEARELL